MQSCPEDWQGAPIDVRDKQPVVTSAERAMRQKNDKAMGVHYQKEREIQAYYQRRMDAMANEARAVVANSKKTKQLADIKKETGIMPGMTEKQVRSKLGNPMRINKGQYSNGSNYSQQWVYRGGHYVYFENGIVTSQQW